ncbi:MAG: creatininase family protein, partial [bacterium]|nr:creatininase family protein [bacterium]
MFFAQLTADEIKDLNKEHLVVLFPVGAIEQHGPHLPVDTDARIVEAIAKKVESKSPEKIIVLPTFSYGVVGTRPGSLNIDYRLFELAILGISKSALDEVFKKI